MLEKKIQKKSEFRDSKKLYFVVDVQKAIFLKLYTVYCEHFRARVLLFFEGLPLPRKSKKELFSCMLSYGGNALRDELPFTCWLYSHLFSVSPCNTFHHTLVLAKTNKNDKVTKKGGKQLKRRI